MTRALLCLLLLLAFYLTGCSKKSSSEEVQEEGAIPVSTIQVKAESVSKTLRVLGEIEAVDSVAVYSKVNGKLLDYAIKKGQEISKGDLIGNIDRDEVGYKYNQAPVYSPISGVVSSLPLNSGSEIRGDTPVAYVMNIDQVKAVFTLPERYRHTVNIGQQIDVIIDSMDHARFSATVCMVNPLIDSATHTFTVEAKIENPKKILLPGMFSSGEIKVETYPETVMLPEETIVPFQGEWYVYTVVNEEALLKKVKLGLRKEGKIQILEGIAPDEVVIVGGCHKVSEGQKVKVL